MSRAWECTWPWSSWRPSACEGAPWPLDHRRLGVNWNSHTNTKAAAFPGANRHVPRTLPLSLLPTENAKRMDRSEGACWGAHMLAHRHRHRPQINCHNHHPPTYLQTPTASLRRHQYDIGERSSKADSTLRSSQAVPHPSTNRALCCLTSEVERDPVHSARYGRRRRPYGFSALRC